MKLLEKDQYYKVVKPLEEVKFNHLFISAVVEQKIDGLVYTDNSDFPTSFYIVHPYGMSLLFGNYLNDEFNHQITDYLLNKGGLRHRIEWMQVYPESWSIWLLKTLGDRLLTKNQKEKGIFSETRKILADKHTRVNFKFNIDKYTKYKVNHPVKDLDIFRTGGEEFQNMPGTVIPKYFWQNESQFLEQGVGFGLRSNGKLACTAFSAFITDHQLELGIETVASFQGKGFAFHTCAALIDYSIENGLEPVWSCRYENIGSYMLAQKLGFEPIRFHPFYKVNL